MKHPSKKKRDWLEQLKKEGLTKSRASEEEDDTDRPKLLSGGMWLWRCFSILNARRQYGKAGPQPLSLADIYAMSQVEGLSGADTRWLCEVVDALDRIYVEDTYDKLAKEQAARSKKAKPGTGVRRR